MKIVMSMVAAAAAIVWLAPADASAQSGGYRAKLEKRHAVPHHRHSGRPASVGPNGLCQRDTGTPTGQLDFRNRCDVEEFWNRTMQGGRRR
jgi:hypothetical protein